MAWGVESYDDALVCVAGWRMLAGGQVGWGGAFFLALLSFNLARHFFTNTTWG
jgi:hypothetical protein